MKHQTPEQVMTWLKCNGWQCVREYYFSADFEKGDACVNVPTWTQMSSYPQMLWKAVDTIATTCGRSYVSLAAEMVGAKSSGRTKRPSQAEAPLPLAQQQA